MANGKTGWEGKPPDVLEEALTGRNEKVLFNEDRWYISVSDTHDGEKVIDVWHWCQNEGTDEYQYAASLTDAKYDPTIGKHRHFIAHAKCWNCPDAGWLPVSVQKTAERLFTGQLI